MTSLLVDTPVLVKWFHTVGETEAEEARLIRQAHVDGRIEALILDLAIYEVGNVALRALRWTAADTAAQLDDLLAIVGPPLALTPAWLHVAADLAASHGLTFYDASWAATAVQLDIALVSADRQLLESGLAESATQTVARHRL